MSHLPRRLYVGGVLLWVAYVLLFPTWVGQIHNPDDFQNPHTWRRDGVFSLHGTYDFYKRAPLWSPPAAHSDAIPSSVRWPWQSASRHEHVEIALARVFARCSLGILVLGILFRGVSWFSPPDNAGPLLSTAWSVSLTLVIAWICILIVAVLSMGYALTDTLVIGFLSFGLLGGVAYGLVTHRRIHARLQALGPASDHSPDLSDAARKQIHRIGSGLLWFTLGVIAGVCVAGAAMYIASFFRGAIEGVTEFGGTRYARDQAPINFATGAGIVATSWLLAIPLVLLPRFRGFALGLLVATMALGALLALGH